MNQRVAAFSLDTAKSMALLAYLVMYTAPNNHMLNAHQISQGPWGSHGKRDQDFPTHARRNCSASQPHYQTNGRIFIAEAASSESVPRLILTSESRQIRFCQWRSHEASPRLASEAALPRPEIPRSARRQRKPTVGMTHRWLLALRLMDLEAM